MPDDGTGEKTEDPTPKRKRDAREKGNVAKSKEISQAFTLLASFLLLYFFMQQIMFNVMAGIERYFSDFIVDPLSVDMAGRLLQDTMIYTVKTIYPVLIVTAVVGFFVNFLQIGPLFTTKNLAPDIKKMDPIKGLKNIFSLRGFVEFLKSLLKLGIIAFIAQSFLKNNIIIFRRSLNQGLELALAEIALLISKMGFTIIAAMVLLGIFDLLYQRWQHNKDLKMSKYEVKQERKEMEGDPVILQKRREKQRQISLNRMMNAVKDADVVITNPTHIAVALQYDLDEMDAPVVVAKGEGFVAEKIKGKAKELEIEIVENKPLARSLNKMAEIGDQIPVELYQAVAEIMAYVFKENNRFN
ncbi:MAG: flagellar biosynthesis protein FlhB [Bacillota bacterium]